jgi:hypothetical protein
MNHRIVNWQVFLYISGNGSTISWLWVNIITVSRELHSRLLRFNHFVAVDLHY